MCLRLVELETSFDIRNVVNLEPSSIAQCIVIGKKSGAQLWQSLFSLDKQYPQVQLKDWFLFYATKVKFG